MKYGGNGDCTVFRQERRETKMIICIDFDGTLVDHAYPEIGKPAPHAVKWLKRLQKYGARLILYTMRSDVNDQKLLTEAVRYLEENGVTLYAVNENPDQQGWTTSPKPFANAYVDDLAVGCPLIQPKGFRRPCVDWNKVGPVLEHMCLSR